MTFSNETLFDQDQFKPTTRKGKTSPNQDNSFNELMRETNLLKSEIQNLGLALNRIEATTKAQSQSQPIEWYKHHWVVAILTAISTSLLWIALLKLTPLSLLTLSEHDKRLYEIGRIKVQIAAREKVKKKN